MERGESSRPTASARRRYDNNRARVRAAELEELEARDPAAHRQFHAQIHTASEPDDDHGGPYDKSLLDSFAGHIAKAIWDDPYGSKKVLDLCYHATSLKRKWHKDNLTMQVSYMVNQTCFGTIANHFYESIDSALVSAFIEHWQPETNSFHMPFGEMTITLDDVRQILGVPLFGTPVFLPTSSQFEDGTNISWETLITRSIGAIIADFGDLRDEGGNVSLVGIRTFFHEGAFIAREMATQQYQDRVFRAWMLYMLGSVVFPNKSSSNVTFYLMKFLMDADTISNYAWGVAILANLYRELGKATRATCCHMSGCVPLLLCWIYEHFSQLRRPTFDSTYSEEHPRLRRWMPTTNPDCMGSIQGPTRCEAPTT